LHLIGFIIIIYHDARSPERQIRYKYLIRTSQREQCYSIIKTNDLILYREIMGDFRKKISEHIDVPRGQIVESFFGQRDYTHTHTHTH